MAVSENQAPTSIRLSLRIVGYHEDGEWVALALEMDLRGYGKTFQKAFENLKDLVTMQVSFAAFKGRPDMIWKNAEPVWFARWESARMERLWAAGRRRLVEKPDTELADLPIPPAHVISRIVSGFALADA
jgi:hypothetical protein